MAKKKEKVKSEQSLLTEAVITDEGIVDTLRKNYMPYAMTVIISRAIPEIDGFKPAHRKLLYTMYQMGLLNSPRTKSSNIVGATMKLNPHGDAAIYETMVRLTRGNDALLHPFIDSKGSFGKQYSDMAYAAPRYTEAKLDAFCNEIFSGIDRDAVDFQDNYDGSIKEPVLLPTAFPNILVSPNTGIAVGMASNICSFNLGEVCDAVCSYIDDENTDFMEIIKAPDFSTGGLLLYDRKQMEEIYSTGKGSFKVRAKYSYNKKDNCIEISEIPYTTKIEAIIDKIASLVKEKKIIEISDVRDETGLEGLRIAIDLKRGADPEKLMQKLYRLTPLEDSFSCNFNVLIEGSPKLMGVGQIIDEWLAWRKECVKRELFYNLQKMREKLHLLIGLESLLLDIDKAIRIIRQTESEKQVIPNLMKGFSIDETQAEYIAEIKLRNLNKEYILKRVSEKEELEKKIAETESILGSDKKVGKLISSQLVQIKKKYAKPRKTEILYEYEEHELPAKQIESYEVYVIMTSEGYFKKIVPGKNDKIKEAEQTLKEGDSVKYEYDAKNDDDLLFFSTSGDVYKAKIDDFDAVKPQALGDYIPAKLGFTENEKVVAMITGRDYKGDVVIFFENGKAVKIPLKAYETKTNRKKLTGGYSTDSPAAGIFYLPEHSGRGTETEYILISSSMRCIILNSAQITSKVTRSSSGAVVFTLKKGQKVQSAEIFKDDGSEAMKIYSKYRKVKLPSAGTTFNNSEQSTLF
ncbi:MAG: topoisomerase IV [Clostridiales bacterium]|nr:MAG: topoisomerase IV [Clostridiales bacterium]